MPDTTSTYSPIGQDSSEAGPSVSVAPSPGTVKITGRLNTIEEANNRLICTIYVDAVDAYGAGVPPLPAGTTIQAKLSYQTAGLQPNEANQATLKQLFPPDQIRALHLKFQRAPDLPGTKPISWHILSIQ